MQNLPPLKAVAQEFHTLYREFIATDREEEAALAYAAHERCLALDNELFCLQQAAKDDTSCNWLDRVYEIHDELECVLASA